MSKTTHALVITKTADVWTLTRDGSAVAVIERAWDDFHWLLFLADPDGELVGGHAYRRVAALKAHVRLWAQGEPRSRNRSAHARKLIATSLRHRRLLLSR